LEVFLIAFIVFLIVSIKISIWFIGLAILVGLLPFSFWILINSKNISVIFKDFFNLFHFNYKSASENE